MNPVYPAMLGLLLAISTMSSCPAAHAQGASPVLDLDRSGTIDPSDVFLFSLVWYQPYDLGLRNFNIADYYPIVSGNRWHYVEEATQTSDVDFAFVVQEEPVELPSGSQAMRILNDFDTNVDFREGVIDYWRYDDAGNLYYEGAAFSNDSPVGNVGTIPAQEVFMTDPVIFGKENQEVGEALVTVTTTEVTVVVEGMTMDVTTEVEATIVPTGFVTLFPTVLGEFTDVLRVRFDIVLRFFIGGDDFTFRFLNSTVFFKKDVGPIAIDFTPDIFDSDLLTIDEGTVVIEGTPTPIVAN
jgi:hypothetical protein